MSTADWSLWGASPIPVLTDLTEEEARQFLSIVPTDDIGYYVESPSQGTIETPNGPILEN